MREKQTKKWEKEHSYMALLLSLILSLVILSTLSYARTNSIHKESLTRHNQIATCVKEFSLKRQEKTINTVNTTEHIKTASGSRLEYVRGESFHSRNALEEKSKNSQEITFNKPPLNQGKAVGEFMTGTVLGLGVGIGAAYVGASISYDGSWFSELPGAIMGFTLAYPLGCALGVYAVGNLGSDTGSFSSALGAAYGGILLGAFSAWALSQVSQTAAGLAFLATPPLFATLAFNKSRRYKNTPAASTSLLNFRDGKMDLGFPVISVLPSAPGSSKLDWLVNLASIEF